MTRYKKAKGKNNDYYVSVLNLKSGGDGGKHWGIEVLGLVVRLSPQNSVLGGVRIDVM